MILIGLLIGISSLFSNTNERLEHFGNYAYAAPGGGGSPFNITEDSIIKYNASGSRFNVYIATQDQFSGYGRGAFGYIAELSRLNVSSAIVEGKLPPGDYIIWMDNIGEANSTAYLHFDVTTHRPGAQVPWGILAIIMLTAITSSFATYIVLSKIK